MIHLPIQGHNEEALTAPSDVYWPEGTQSLGKEGNLYLRPTETRQLVFIIETPDEDLCVIEACQGTADSVCSSTKFLNTKGTLTKETIVYNRECKI